MPSVSPLSGLRLTPKKRRARRRTLPADAGQVHRYEVPTHLDDPDTLKFGMTAEQLLQIVAGLMFFAVLAVAAVILGPGPLVGWRTFAPLLAFLTTIVPVIQLARWRPDDQLPLFFVLDYLTYRQTPKLADWEPRSNVDAFHPEPRAADDLEDA